MHLRAAVDVFKAYDILAEWHLRVFVSGRHLVP